MSTVKQLYKRLNELSLIISSNLKEIDSAEFVKQVLEIIPYTRVSIYSELFEDALRYYKIQKDWPDFDYVNMHFPDLMSELDDEEPAYHYSFQGEYIKLLQRDSLLRKLDKAIADDDLELVNSIVESDPLFNIAEDNLKTWEDLFEAYETIKHDKDPLSFGIRELDKMYNGLCPGTLNIFAAPPGKFKTTCACSVAYTNFIKNKRVLYITLEDSWDVLLFNFTTRESYEQSRQISAPLTKIGKLDDEDEQTLKEIIRDCSKKYPSLQVACQQTWSDFSPTGLLRLLRETKRRLGGLDLVILDHASLLKFYRVKGITDPKEVINFYIRFLTNLSISFEDKFALLVLMQTNRDGVKELEAGKTGSLTNLAEANEAERSASTVTLIYSGPNAVESNIINFYPKKNRRGTLTAKPIISFIDPAVYFVGEKAIEGDLDLDDFMDDMVEDHKTTKKKAEAKPVEHTETEIKKPKKLNSYSENKTEQSSNNSTSIKKRKIRKLNKNVVSV